MSVGGVCCTDVVRAGSLMNGWDMGHEPIPQRLSGLAESAGRLCGGGGSGGFGAWVRGSIVHAGDISCVPLGQQASNKCCDMPSHTRHENVSLCICSVGGRYDCLALWAVTNL